MRSSNLLCPSLSSMDIFQMGNSLKVPWIDTTPHSTQVIQFQTSRYRFSEMFVADAVSHWSTATKADVPVASIIKATHEYPATAFGDHFDLFEQSFGYRSRSCRMSAKHWATSMVRCKLGRGVGSAPPLLV